MVRVIDLIRDVRSSMSKYTQKIDTKTSFLNLIFTEQFTNSITKPKYLNVIRPETLAGVDRSLDLTRAIAT